MRARTAIVVLIGALALAGQAGAVTLVTPQGAPVGGKWQRWADQAKIATVPGTLTFTTDATICKGPRACSWGPPWYGSQRGTAVADSPTARHDLYFELGHQFDWELLTWADRGYIERHWTFYSPRGFYQHGWRPWQDTLASIGRGTEDGVEGMFAVVYGDCAAGKNDNNAEIGFVSPRINTCTYIERVAGRSSASSHRP